MVGRLSRLRHSAQVVCLAAKHPRTPWYAKLLVALVVGYLLNPIDLIPDFLPVVGHLDDLLLVPAGLALAMKLIPPDVLLECRHQAEM